MSEQSRKGSFIEAVVATAIGFVLGLGAQMALFPLFGLETSFSNHAWMVAVFTAISFVRSYWVRRLFNSSPWRRFKERKDGHL